MDALLAVASLESIKGIMFEVIVAKLLVTTKLVAAAAKFTEPIGKLIVWFPVVPAAISVA
jgi:hypothetical protein